jgi:hypothetical protein
MNFFRNFLIALGETIKDFVFHMKHGENTGRCNELFVKECARSVKAKREKARPILAALGQNG